MSAPKPVRPEPRPGILAIDTYVPGKSGRPGGGKVHKLSSNETPLGPSPAALAALHEATAKLETYPDGRATVLRTAIAKRYGLDPERIVCGAGLRRAALAAGLRLWRPGHRGHLFRARFLVYRIAILASGATPVVAPERDYTTDVDAILARVTERTRIVYVTNPSNPTGTYLPFDEIRRLHAALPANVLLVIDGAYAEYVRANDYSAGLELALEAENVVMTRTFSKIYGLAAVRIGWMLAPSHVAIRSTASGAVQRLRPGHRGGRGRHRRRGAHGGGRRPQRRVAAQAHRRRPGARPESDAERRQLRADPLPRRTGALGRRRRRLPLTERGLITRRVSAYGLPNALRVTVAGPRRTPPSWRRSATSCGARMPEGILPEAATPPIGRLTIVGLGLIGSSIARAARRYNLAGTIVALDRDAAVRERVAELGIADVVTGDPREGASETDLVILCVPVGAIGAAAAELAPYLKPGAIVSDVGSVKGAVVAAIRPHLPEGVALVPGHPIAGTEFSGPDAGFATLFQNRWCILTPPEGTDPAAVERSGPCGRAWAPMSRP